MRLVTHVLFTAASLLVAVAAAEGRQAADQAAPVPPANEDCMACHVDPTLTRVNGASLAVDNEIFAASKHGAMACVDCHADLASLVEYPHPEKLSRVTCANCHSEIGTEYDDSIHARARERSGLNVAPTCAGCHGSHDILEKDDPKSRVSHLQVPVTCGVCHEGITTRYETGVHATALRAGDPQAPSCATCHTAHDIQRVDIDATRLRVAAECGTCHRSVVETYARTFHGKVTQLGSAGVAACADCHRSHDILPATNPASTVAPGNLITTCGRCHTGADASFVQYDPHPNPSNYERSPVLWWVNRFYWVLIPACFGFFGLHSLLWFWRAKREQHLGKEAR
jgi:hypothetical protein